MPDTKTSINYIYQVSKRKTIGIKICSKDTIKVSFPSGYRSQAEAFVLKKQPWITKKLSDIADRFSNTPNFESLMTQLSDKKSVE